MTYNAIVEDTGSDGYTASILGWPDCTAKDATKGEALAWLRQTIANRLSRGEIVPIEVDVPRTVIPWPSSPVCSRTTSCSTSS